MQQQQQQKAERKEGKEKERKLHPSLTTCAKINPIQIVDLYITPKTIQSVEENIGEKESL